MKDSKDARDFLLVNDNGEVQCSDAEFLAAIEGWLGIGEVKQGENGPMACAKNWIVAEPHEGKVVVGWTANNPSDEYIEVKDEKIFDENDKVGIVEHAKKLVYQFHIVKMNITVN